MCLMNRIKRRMMLIEENYDLTSLNTMGVSAKARYFSRFTSIEELKALQANPLFSSVNKLCLGSGSNILFTQDFAGLVMHNGINGVEILEEKSERVRLKVGAGENWHEFVSKCVQKNWGGLENLSLIPGTVGAAPIQNCKTQLA